MRALRPRQGAAASTLGDDRQLLGQGGEHLAVLLAADHEILDADAEAVGQVDAGLDGHHAAGAQRLLSVRARESWGLVHVHADPVTEAVTELLAVARTFDHGSRHRVDLAPARTRRDRLHALLLGRAHELVDLTRLRRSALAGGVRARAVRAVALHACAPVDREQNVWRDLLLPRFGVRERAARAGCDDRGKGGLGAEVAHAVLQRERDLALAPPDDAPFQEPGHRLVRELRGGADPREL